MPAARSRIACAWRREDITIRTALLEHRFIAGDAALATELTRPGSGPTSFANRPEFIEAKLAERAERHRKQGGQRYVLEPNVKEGKGGLRDLQTLYWIGKYLHRVPDARPPLVGTACSRRGIRHLCAGRDLPVGGALPHAPDRGPGDGPADLRHAGRGGRAHGLCVTAAGAGRSSISCRTTSATPPAWAN
jgi:hypothetical protein